MRDLIVWLIGCWTYEGTEWTCIMGNVVSCVIRAGIIAFLAFVFYQLGGHLLDAI